MKLNETIVSTHQTNKHVLDILDNVASNSLGQPVSYSGTSLTFSTTKVKDNREFTAAVDTLSTSNRKLSIRFRKTDSATNGNTTQTNMAEISIPESVIRQYNLTSTDVVVSALRDGKIFPKTDTRTSTTSETTSDSMEQTVGSYIIATSFYNRSVQNTIEDIEVKFRMSNLSDAEKGVCSYWEENKGKGISLA